MGTALRVGEVSPGLVKTEFSNVRFKGDAAKADAVYENLTPLVAEDVADNVLYIASRYIHNHTLIMQSCNFCLCCMQA